MQLLPVDVLAQFQPSIQSLLKELVLIESPSTDKKAVDRLGRYLIPNLTELGGEVEVFPQETNGDHIACRWGSGPSGLLILCHMDTVYDLGTLERQPYLEADGKIFGPGVLDMKDGIANLLTVLRVFHQQGIWPTRPITALFTSDEEIGSLTSRDLIVDLARQSAAVFCMEPALPNGAIKTARKGTGDIDIRVKGIAAHAGTDHEKGRNAIEELAYHIIEAQKLTDYTRGTTVNVGVIGGGTRGNVVPEEAHALIDFRVQTLDEVERLQAWVDHLSPVISGTSVSANLIVDRPPMPRDAVMAGAFEKARAIAQGLGMALTEGSTGGGSDANFVAPLGILVLDGLSGVGDGAHSEREYVIADSLPKRAALLAGLLLNW